MVWNSGDLAEGAGGAVHPPPQKNLRGAPIELFKGAPKFC